MRPVTRILPFLLLAGLLLPASALAHKVNIFAYADGGTVYAESYYPDGRPVVDGKVQVYDSQQKLLLETQTDQEGLLEFKLPKLDDLTLVINAGMGHKNSYLLKKTAIHE